MFKKIFKFLKKNIGIEEIIIASLSIYLIYSLKNKIVENMDDQKRVIVFYKPPKPADDKTDSHHINIARIELFDENDEKVELTPHKYSSSSSHDHPLASALDGKNDTFTHTGYNEQHKWVDPPNFHNNGRRYISFTFPTNKNIKRIYVRNREGQEYRLKDMRVTIYPNLNSDIEKLHGNLYNHVYKDDAKGLDIDLTMDIKSQFELTTITKKNMMDDCKTNDEKQRCTFETNEPGIDNWYYAQDIGEFENKDELDKAIAASETASEPAAEESVVEEPTVDPVTEKPVVAASGSLPKSSSKAPIFIGLFLLLVVGAFIFIKKRRS
jgi:hypothetical protein